jgi:hypothetical protein
MSSVSPTREESENQEYQDDLLARSLERLERVGLNGIVWLTLVPTWTEGLASAAQFPTREDSGLDEFLDRAAAEGYCAIEPTEDRDGTVERELRVRAALGAWLSSDDLERTLQLVATATTDSLRARVLVGTAVALDGVQAQRAATLAAEIGTPANRAAALAALAAKQPALVSEAVDAAMEVSSPARRAQLLTQLVPLGSPATPALEAASTIDDSSMRGGAWSELASYVDASQAVVILAGVDQVEDRAARVHLLTRLVPRLDDAGRSAALEEAAGLAFDDPAALLDVVEAAAAAGAVRRAEQLARSLRDDDLRALALGLAACGALRNDEIRLAEKMLTDAEVSAGTAGSLAAIGQLLREVNRPWSLRLAREAARRLQEPNAPPARLRDLQAVIRLLADPDYPDDREAEALAKRALELARAIPDERDRADALVQLTGLFPQRLKLVGEAAEAVERIADVDERAAFLASLAPQLSAETLQDAIQKTLKLAKIGPGRTFWMPRSVRPQVLDVLTRHLDLRQEAVRIASAISSAKEKSNVPVAPAVQRWVDVASRISSREQLAETAAWFDHQVAEALRAGEIGRALDWIDTGSALADAVGDELSAIVRYANRRLELVYRRLQDERALGRFLLREEQVAAFDRLLLSGDQWALHYLGVGGVGKTMLLRHLAKIASEREIAMARVDFDYLTADYPTRRPAQLLLELMADLGTYASSNRHEAQIESFRDSVVRLHESTAAGLTEDPLAAIRSSQFESALRAFRDFVQLLDRRVVLVLDTCEELAKYEPAGFAVPSVAATFEVIERIRGSDDIGRNVRVVFAGRRPLARSGGVGDSAWTVGDADTASRALLPVAKDYLSVYEIRGFTRSEAHRFLTEIAKLDLDEDMERAILDKSPETGRVASLQQAHAPPEESRFSPFDLAFQAEWVQEVRPESSAAITSAGADVYIERRIIQRVEHDVAALLPAVVLLRRFDDDLLRPVFPGGDASFASALRKLRDQEWISTSRDPDARGAFLQLDENMRPRLRAYYEHPSRRDKLEQARRKLAEPLEARIDGSDLGDVPIELMRSVLEILDPEIGCALWQRVGLRIATEGRWDWAGQATRRALADDDGLPDAHPARASLYAAQAAALIHLGQPEYPEGSWGDCARMAAGEPDAATRAWLDARVRAGRAVGRARRAEEGSLTEVLDVFPGPRHSDARVACAMTEQLAASLCAALEAQLEAEQPVEFDAVRSWVERLDVEDVSPVLRAYARILAARAVLADDRVRAADLLEEAQTVLPRTSDKGEERWLDWMAPGSIRCRAGLELWRLSRFEAGPLVPAEASSYQTAISWETEAMERAASIDGERLLSVVLATRLAQGPILEENLAAVEAAAGYDPGRRPTSAVHASTPPLFVTVARGWLAVGNPSRALSLLETHLAAATATGVDAAQTVLWAERTKLEVIRRMRLSGAEPVLVARMLESAEPEDVELATACVTVAGGYTVQSLDWRSRPDLAQESSFGVGPRGRLDRAEWQLIMAEKPEGQVPLRTWQHDRPVPLVEDAVRLDLRAVALGVVADVGTTDRGALGTVVSAAEARLGPRRLAELALDEGELLLQSLPEQAVLLLGISVERFKAAGDRIGLLLATACSVVAMAHAALGDLRADARTALEEGYREAALEGRPPWDALVQVGRDQEKVNALFEDREWGGWLLRINAGLVWCLQGPGPAVAPAALGAPPLELALRSAKDERVAAANRRRRSMLWRVLVSVVAVGSLAYAILLGPTVGLVAGLVVLASLMIGVGLAFLKRLRRKSQAFTLKSTALRLVMQRAGETRGDAWPEGRIDLTLYERKLDNADLGTLSDSWTSPPVGPYASAGGNVPLVGPVPELRALRTALRGTVNVPLEVQSGLEGLPWEAFLEEWTKPRLDADSAINVFRWARPIPRGSERVVARNGAVRVVTDRTWSALASEIWSYRADSGTIAGDMPVHGERLAVLHLIGRPVSASRGSLFQIAATADRLSSEVGESVRDTGSLVLPHEAAERAVVVIVQAEPANVVVRVDTDREEAAKVRVFAAEVFAAGARLVVAIPALPPALAEKAVAELATCLGGRSHSRADQAVMRVQAGLGTRPDRDLIRVLRAIKTMRRTINDWPGFDSEELSLDVSVFGRQGLPTLPGESAAQDRRAVLRGLARPVTQVDLRPDPKTKPVEALYVRSYLLLRVFVGLFFLLLPVAIIFLDKALFNESPFPRGSISAYYYSGVRDLFVIMLSSTGAFLIAYKVAERNLDNLASAAAGLCAVAIALFPTARTSPTEQLTKLQLWLGERPVGDVHFVASIGLVVWLTLLSVTFGFREFRRLRRVGQHFSPTFWGWLHYVCGGAMAFALIWSLIATSARALLIGEWIACWAFGVSWLAKGAEIDMLIGRSHPIAPPPAR